MKKFFTQMPLQVNGAQEPLYEAIGNSRLQMDQAVGFPILCAISGYAERGDEICVIAIVVDDVYAKQNSVVFEQELKTLSLAKGFTYKIETVLVPKDDQVSTHVETFQKLIDYVEDDDELFSCMTYGTKPLSTAALMAVEYALRVKKNTSVTCVVYGEIRWKKRDDSSRDKKEIESAKIYDMTALIQMDEIVHLLAKNGDPDPKKTINRLLTL